jgi:RNA polymerase sigma-70 factor (ECF subfamily)
MEQRMTALPRGTADPTEADLLRQAQGGNRFAFEEIVRRYQRRVYAVALRIVRRHEQADDVAQESFLRAWQRLDSFDTARPFGPWICRISANLAVNQVRSPIAREQELPDTGDEAAPSAEGPLTAVLDAEARAQLDQALSALPADQRAVFVLRTYEEMSYEEIGEALALPPGTVMSRLSRARERLRAALLPYLRGGGGRP